MNYRLQRIDAVQTANVMAVIYGVMMAVIAVITIPFLLLGMLMAPPGTGDRGSLGMSLAFMILYPFLGIFLGWISGWAMAALFNFVAKRTGGVRVALESLPAPAA
jgi:hypothetical protein